MSSQAIVGNRWTVLYDQAAKEHAEACRKHHRTNIRGWKGRLEWLDRKLKEERGEK